MTVDLLLSRARSGMVDLQPEFQRRWGIWDQRRQSRLIESMLLRIPLPNLYAAEDENERWEIVDGIQRLSTVARFIEPDIVSEDGFALTEVRDTSHEAMQYFWIDDSDGRQVLVEVEGLGLAHFFDGAAVSFDRDQRWVASVVPLVLHSMESDASIVETHVSARNFASAMHVHASTEWLSTFAVEEKIANGAELWERRSELFPNLEFIPRTKNQIMRLGAGEHLFLQTQAALSKLNRSVEEWDPKQTPVPSYPFHVRPESESRINEGLFDFDDGSGTTVTFSPHVYLAPPPHRLHFVIRSVPRKMAVIGHVGRKLGIG